MLLDGITVGSHPLSDQETVLNQANRGRKMLADIEVRHVECQRKFSLRAARSCRKTAMDRIHLSLHPS